MKTIDIKTLAEVLDVEVINGRDGEITSVSTDSRTVKQGDCFFAIKGEKFDGHDHVKEAFEKGTACAVVSKNTEDCDGPLLKVDDTVKALGKLANWYRMQGDYKVVAITGTAGKTTTREMIYHVLKQHYKCYRSPKSFNNNIGLPLTLLGAGADTEIIIAEIGSNHPGEIEELTKIACPDIAVVTNVYPAHLQGLNSIENIIKEKTSICLGLREKGKFLINGDIRDLVEHCKTFDKRFITFGKRKKCDIRGIDFKTSGLSGSFNLKLTTVTVPLAGRANLYNALAAWAVCKQFGISKRKFAEAIKTIESMEMRLDVVRTGMLTVINDCYNANPASMRNAIECLCDIGANCSGRKVFVCGTMAELGDESEELHRQLGENIAENEVDVLLAVGEYGNVVVNSAADAGKEGIVREVFENCDQLCDNLPKFIRAEDVVLVKGSRSVGLEKAVEKLKEISGPKS